MESSSTGIFGFLLTCLIMELTPGPNMGYLALLSATYGRKVGFITVAGIASGLLVLGLGASFGLNALIDFFPPLYTALRWAGSAYMLWLAWEAWSTATTPSPPAPTLHGRYFRRGFITNLLNPKALVFYLTILPQFVLPSAHATTQTLLLMLVSVLIATLAHVLIVLIASPLSAWLAHEQRRRHVQRAFAVLLACIAVWLMW